MLIYSNLIAQHERDIWYFGNFAGIQFPNSGFPLKLENSRMNAGSGCSSIADSAGNLLFYTEGVTVWDRNHDTMKNGFALNGTQGSSQSVLIVKMPGKANIYYIFTADTTNSEVQSENKGYCYSIVDMNSNSGLGEVIVKNKLLYRKSSELLSAVGHANKRDIWISCMVNNSDSILVFKLTDTGISSPIVNTVGIVNNHLWQPGVMKFSSDGTKLAYINGRGIADTSGLVIVDFNPSTGKISNVRNIKNSGQNLFWGIMLYGLEFSPNSRFLYLSTYCYKGNIYQIDLSKLNIGFTLFDSIPNLISVGKIVSAAPGTFCYAGLQLGPDGRIYISKYGDNYLDAIEFPDRQDTSCMYKYHAVNLGSKKCWFGLPSFVQSEIFHKPELLITAKCNFDSSSFEILNYKADSVLWDFGDSELEVEKSNTIKHIYKDSGKHQIKVYLYKNNVIDTLLGEIDIPYINTNLIGRDTIICYGLTHRLTVNQSRIETLKWNSGSNDSFMLLDSAGLYWVQIRTNQCKASDSIEVKFGEKKMIYLGEDTLFCHKFKYTLSANLGFKTYNWNTGDTTFEISVNKKGLYSVIVADSNSCNATDSINIDEYLMGKISILYDSITCKFVNLSIPKQNGFKYIWNTGDTSNFINVETKGSYIVTSSNAYCSAKDTITIDALSKPFVYLGQDTTLCKPLFLYANENGKYLWNTGEQSRSIFIHKPGTYWLEISRNNCTTYDTIEILPCKGIVQFIPNAFSPNNDGKNDIFKVYGLNIIWTHMYIYNRWGELLFDSEGEEIFWDGKYSSDVCPNGYYMYYIDLKGQDGTIFSFKGVLHLQY